MRRRPRFSREVWIFVGLTLLVVLGFGFLVVCVAAIYEWNVPDFMRSIGGAYVGLVALGTFIGAFFGRKQRAVGGPATGIDVSEPNSSDPGDSHGLHMRAPRPPLRADGASIALP